MTRIVLISDTHSYLDPQLTNFFQESDEIWHAGDVGNYAIFQSLEKFDKPFRCVFGNIDGKEIRVSTKENLFWEIEGMKIFMTHIGGSPNKYPARVKNLFLENKPDVFVCGHSHILKVIYDHQWNFLHLNPGACGKEGFHKVRTALKFNIDQGKIIDMAIIELGKRG